jgi:hypothetical protein
MGYELREYSFGETIGKGFNLYFNNLPPLFPIALLCQIPSVLLINWQPVAVKPEWGKLAIFFLLNTFCQSFLSAGIIYLVSRKFLKERELSFNQNMGSILSLIMPLIMLSILVGIKVGVASLLLLIPGIVVSLGYSVASNVLVIERKSVTKSMKRSWDLTKGDKGRIFLLLLVGVIIVACIQQPLVYVIRKILPTGKLTVYLNLIVSAIFQPIQSCILVVIYFNLRIKKEGFDIEHLIQQFSLVGERDRSVEG